MATTFLPFESSVGFQHGSNGLRTYVGEVTLSIGSGTLAVPFRDVVAVFVAHKDATALSTRQSWTTQNSYPNLLVKVDSSGSESGEVMSVLVFGF